MPASVCGCVCSSVCGSCARVLAAERAKPECSAWQLKKK